MSRKDDEKELRKLEYLNRRGVATFDDRLKQKELARKMALEDFEESERLKVKDVYENRSEKNGVIN
jgi:hypothetical protein